MNILLTSLTIGSVILSAKGNPVVELPLGIVKGRTEISVNGNEFYVFEGIPYAKPPVGENRFEKSLPVQSWDGTRDANTIHKCLQYRHQAQSNTEDPVTGSEDCLYLNIYTPTLDVRANFDVIVFIHGGAFMFNYGAFQGPGTLLDKRIVYVNFNYRLGPLGFLSTEDDVVPGNNGLEDQIAALKFVKDYIKYFGGNPNSITITGNSAGGASVHFHYLIDKSKGLFHKGISQSGTALNSWVLMEDPLRKTNKIASSLGCPTRNSKEMIDCLKRRPGKQIVETIKLFQPWLYNPFSPFGVVVDRWAKDPLLPDHPYQLLKKEPINNVPWIASHVNSEGLYPAAEFYSNDNYLKSINEKWDKILPHLLHYAETVDDKNLSTVNGKIRKFYFGNKAVDKDTFGELVQMIGDRLFVVDIHKAVKLHATVSSAPTYLYYFTYRGEHSRSEQRAKSRKNFGAAHGDDASYILNMSLDTRSNENDRLMSEIMTNIWLSVAKSGKPQVPSLEWLPVSKNCDEINYLKIAAPDKLSMEGDEHLGNRQFWDSLPFRENDKLFDSVEKDEL